ncbi:MAG: hypothetical protein R3E89_18585 [Thiolinea sp.]
MLANTRLQLGQTDEARAPLLLNSHDPRNLLPRQSGSKARSHESLARLYENSGTFLPPCNGCKRQRANMQPTPVRIVNRLPRPVRWHATGCGCCIWG